MHHNNIIHNNNNMDTTSTPAPSQLRAVRADIPEILRNALESLFADRGTTNATAEAVSIKEGSCHYYGCSQGCSPESVAVTANNVWCSGSG